MEALLGIGAIIAGVLLVLAVVTPQGRDGLKRLANLFGAKFQIGVEDMESAATDRAELETKVTTETTANLANAQAANTRAEEILQRDADQEKELAQWVKNRDDAKAAYLRLTTDTVPDEKQQQQIGQARSIGESAMQKITGIETARKLNAENIAWAHDVVAETHRLYQALPARAAELLAAGDVAAASAELAKAQTALSSSQSAFSNSGASQVLARMQKKASRSKAEAKAASSRATAAPASAGMAAQQLASLGTTSSFDDFVKSGTTAA